MGPPDNPEVLASTREFTRQSPSPQNAMASRAPPPPMNPWEAQALTHSFSSSGIAQDEVSINNSDPLFFPQLYCPSGWDLINILLQVRCRPNPLIDLGPIDCSVSLTLCDLEDQDMPIVYASDAFYELTGYSEHEVIGRNCRFLQAPYGMSDGYDKAVSRRMGSAIRNNQEIQLELWNWKKNGQPFKNVLSIIPITIGGRRYAVGLQCEV